ncbi:MAG: electron transfer flavoprotein subunit beta/FixA family protein [Ignavibacterium sp.]
MKIAVCISQVPDTATRIKINADQKSIDPAGVTFIINPYDEFAIEEALKTKEKLGGDTIVYVISVGDDSVKETLRKALAMGADEAILLKSSGFKDSFGIAKALSEEIKSLGCELVFCGKQSVDFDSGITGQLVSEILGYNCISVVVDFKLEGNKIIAEREIEGGREVVETELPAVITAQKGLNEPRYASLKGIMAAKKKTIAEKPANDFNGYTQILDMHLPPSKQPGRVLGTDKSAVPELVKLLREEAKVI